MARRKKKNNITEIAIPASVVISLLIVFYPDTLESIIKALLLITLLIESKEQMNGFDRRSFAISQDDIQTASF